MTALLLHGVEQHLVDIAYFNVPQCQLFMDS